MFAAILFPLSLVCQERPIVQDFKFKARLLEHLSSTPIGYAHIINMRNGRGCISDPSGYFTIQVKINDTIRISGISYYEIYCKITEAELFSLEIPVFKMTEKIYKINEVEIKGITWNSFKYTIKNMKLPEKEEQYSGKTLQLFNKEQMQSLIANATKTGIPFQLKSRAEKSREKVNEFIEKDKLNKKARNKLIDLVDSFTDLDGDQIDEFIKYCKIPRAFVLRSTDYEIMVILEKKWEQYKLKLPAQQDTF